MSCFNIQILPDGNLLVKTSLDQKNTEGIPHNSIADFLRSNDYDVTQVFEYNSSNLEYFKDSKNRKYYIIYSLDHPNRCWKIWDTEIHKLYDIVCGDGQSVIFERMPFHSDYYINRTSDDILFHQKEQSDLREIKIKKILE